MKSCFEIMFRNTHADMEIGSWVRGCINTYYTGKMLQYFLSKDRRCLVNNLLFSFVFLGGRGIVLKNSREIASKKCKFWFILNFIPELSKLLFIFPYFKSGVRGYDFLVSSTIRYEPHPAS